MKWFGTEWDGIRYDRRGPGWEQVWDVADTGKVQIELNTDMKMNLVQEIMMKSRAGLRDLRDELVKNKSQTNWKRWNGLDT